MGEGRLCRTWGVGGGRGRWRRGGWCAAQPHVPRALERRTRGVARAHDLRRQRPPLSFSVSCPPSWWGGSVGEGNGNLGRRQPAAGLDAAAAAARRGGGVVGRFRGGGDGQSPRYAGATCCRPAGGGNTAATVVAAVASGETHRRAARSVPRAVAGATRWGSKGRRQEWEGGRVRFAGLAVSPGGGAPGAAALPSPAAAGILDDSRRPRRRGAPLLPPPITRPGWAWPPRVSGWTAAAR